MLDAVRRRSVVSEYASLKSMAGLSLIRNMVLERSWYAGHPAYEHADGRIVRAYLHLLNAAVRSTPPGVVSADASKLATLCELAEKDVAENWEVLTAGWVLIDDGLLLHRGIEHFVSMVSGLHASTIAAAEEAVTKVEKAIASTVVAQPGRRPSFVGKRGSKKSGGKEEVNDVP